MNITTKIIGGLVIAGGIGVIATPAIYQKQVTKAISIQKQSLAQKGIEISKKSDNDSFFQVNREYILTIKDITPIIKELYPNIKSYDLKSLKKSFDNTKFLVQLNFLKYPISHKDAAKIYLYKLNNYSTQTLSKKLAGQEILEFIKNKGLEVIIDTNSLDIAKVKLKDIDLTLHKSKTSKNSMTFKINNGYTLFSNKTNSLTNIDNIYFHLTDTGFNTTLNIGKTNYKLSKQNDFNYKTSSSIQNISYDYSKKLYYSNRKVKFNITLKNILSNSNVTSIVNNLSILNTLFIKETAIKANNGSIKIENFKLTNKFDKLDLASIKKIIDIYNSSNNVNRQQLKQAVQALINKGFVFTINPLSFDKITIDAKKHLDISKLDLKFDLNLSPNDFDMNNRINRLLNYISADLHIKTTKDNINLLTKINPLSAIYLSQVLTETKNGVSVDISYKKGKITSNGKRIQ